jgi:ribosomal protein L37AE/L43A
MNFLDKLERKFGRYAIKDLPRYIVGCYIIGAVIDLVAPNMYYQYMALSPYMILRGQVWRIVTFLFAPIVDMRSLIGLLFVIFVLMFYYNIVSSLEHVWGSFRFNMYMLTGILGTIIGSFIMYAITPSPSVVMDTYYLQLTLFLAYASLFPNVQVMLYGIIPLKVKWIAYVDVAYLLYLFVTAGTGVYGLSSRVSIAISILNFLIYFFAGRNGSKYRPSEIKRKKKFVKHVQQSTSGARHKCAVCHRTEQDDPTLEFRYCSKCEGNYEYCQDHLFTHTHVKNPYKE